MKRSEQFGDIVAALAKARAQFEAILKERVAVIKSDKANYTYGYADLATVLEAVTPSLSAHGLVIQQSITQGNNAVCCHTALLHTSGQFFEDDGVVVPYEAAEGKADAKKVGSAITYARRMGAVTMLGVAAKEDDDDGDSIQSTTQAATKTPQRKSAAKQDDGAKPAGPGEKAWAKKTCDDRKLTLTDLCKANAIDFDAMTVAQFATLRVAINDAKVPA